LAHAASISTKAERLANDFQRWRHRRFASDPRLLAEILIILSPAALALANGFVVLDKLDLPPDVVKTVLSDLALDFLGRYKGSVRLTDSIIPPRMNQFQRRWYVPHRPEISWTPFGKLAESHKKEGLS